MIKKILAATLVLAIIVGIGYLYFSDGRIRHVYIAGQKVAVKLASTKEELQYGLAGVKQLNWNEGMLFIFPVSSQYQFWMKDMEIPLDIIWLRDTTIVQITENVPAPTDLKQQENLPLYTSRESVNNVLEVPAGFVQRYKVQVGDVVKYD